MELNKQVHINIIIHICLANSDIRIYTYILHICLLLYYYNRKKTARSPRLSLDADYCFRTIIYALSYIL